MRILFTNIIVCVIFCSLSFAQNSQLKFERFSTEQGLSQSTVNCIYRDQKGFLWIGTVGGLNRFDGYSFKVFRPVPGDTSGLRSASIGFIYPDAKYPNKSLWVGTEDGRLYRFNLQTEQIDQIPIRFNNQILNVTTICHDPEEGIWLGTTEHGLLKINNKCEIIKNFQNDPEDETSLSGNFVSDILCTRNGLIWSGIPGSGVDCLNPKTGKIYHFSHNPKDRLSLSSNLIQCLFEDSKSHIWVGTKEGLNRFEISFTDKSNNYSEFKSIKFQRFIYSPGSESSINSNSVMHLTEDERGSIWIATYGGGLNKFNPGEEKFIHYRNNPSDPQSISNNAVKYVYNDKLNQILWFGTDGGGLGKLNFQTVQNIILRTIFISMILYSRIHSIITYQGNLHVLMQDMIAVYLMMLR